MSGPPGLLRRRNIARVLRLAELTRVIAPQAMGIAVVYARAYRRAWHGPRGRV